MGVLPSGRATRPPGDNALLAFAAARSPAERERLLAGVPSQALMAGWHALLLAELREEGLPLPAPA